MFIVDRIEDGFVVLENYSTKEYFPVDKKQIEFEIHDGDVLMFVDGKYIKDLDLKNKREEIIIDKFNRLKNI